MMKKIIQNLAALLVMGLFASTAQAECYYAYKAKKENPLQLHFGVIRVDEACSAPTNQAAIAKRIAADGWTLLVVLPPIEQHDLPSKREEAGAFFLRY